MLQELDFGQKVWIKDLNAERVVQRKHNSPGNYWVKVSLSVPRRNRKHLFTFTISNSELEIVCHNPVCNHADTDKDVTESKNEVIA